MSDEREEFRSIKVKEGTYKKIKQTAADLGVGISKAIDSLAKVKSEAVSEKIREIGEVGGEIADVLLDAGVFDIKFKGAGVTEAKEEENNILIYGFIKIEIPDRDIRTAVLEAVQSGGKD